mmetsp:Transcript_73470/g.220795  ORF Transcript_73470/g.220795 Transcript_73470/m.220795 type:complete len:360 (+) Transcript_73470:497-1576(+)
MGVQRDDGVEQRRTLLEEVGRVGGHCCQRRAEAVAQAAERLDHAEALTPRRHARALRSGTRHREGLGPTLTREHRPLRVTVARGFQQREARGISEKAEARVEVGRRCGGGGARGDTSAGGDEPRDRASFDFGDRLLGVHRVDDRQAARPRRDRRAWRRAQRVAAAGPRGRGSRSCRPGALRALHHHRRPGRRPPPPPASAPRHCCPRLPQLRRPPRARPPCVELHDPHRPGARRECVPTLWLGRHCHAARRPQRAARRGAPRRGSLLPLPRHVHAAHRHRHRGARHARRPVAPRTQLCVGVHRTLLRAAVDQLVRPSLPRATRRLWPMARGGRRGQRCCVIEQNAKGAACDREGANAAA